MSFSINTNVASLTAQNYLRINQNFQSQTINRVTSGLRIVQSGDDAAGLAIANGYRSDEAVLTQGIQNANDGLSQLQIMDGGMNNISQLLDRASTLATESATGTFTGDRNVLNNEFQSVLSEINRQAQSIGLNTGGAFAKTLQVFIGGGKADASGSTESVIANGSINLDLSKSTVDTKSLGLTGLQALSKGNQSSQPIDLGNSSVTSVANIIANQSNQASEAVSGVTNFLFSGPGFSNGATTGSTGPVTVAVNLTGVTDTNSLVTAINEAIANAGNGTSAEASAFKNANITASIVTDANGHQSLAFNSGTSPFQVQAGDNVANALLGNFTGTNTAAGSSALASLTAQDAATTSTAAETVNLRVYGLGAGATDLSVSIGGTDALGNTGDTSAGTLIGDINHAIATNATLSKTGLVAVKSGSSIAFQAPAGSSFEVQVSNDTHNFLGFGNFQSDSGFAGSTFVGAAGSAAQKSEGIQIAVGNKVVDLGYLDNRATGTAASGVAVINTAIAGLSAANKAVLQAAGVTATLSSSGKVEITSTNGTSFRVGLYGTGGANDGDAFGFGAPIATTTPDAPATTASSYGNVNTVNSGGAQESVGKGGSATAPYTFSGIRTAGETQVISIVAKDATGGQHTQNITLDTTNASSLDNAINAINLALQQSSDPTLQGVVAVKEQSTGGAEGIRFLSNDSFSVSLGTSSAGEGLADVASGSPVQGEVLSSSTLAGGSVADISNIATAQAAVTALTNATKALGDAQAVVGKGENQFTYAINLAQSEVTNLTTAESGIRDADLASEAANLTKAQILLQAGVAALAQANSAPQQVLSLLKG